jgi:predicted nucleic acid-binding protein
MSDKPVLAESIVLNSSPLLTLFKSKLDGVLPTLFRAVVVPDAVWQEVGVYRDRSWRRLAGTEWIRRQTVEIDERVLAWNLGKGESEVLSWALNHTGFIVGVDDLAARRCAKALGIRLIGTAGILVVSSRLGLIPSLQEALADVEKAGLYLKEELVRRLVQEETSRSS